jgi:hypothetical protein
MNSILLDQKSVADLERALKDFTSDNERTDLYAGASNRVFGGLTEYFAETRGNRGVEPLPSPDMVFLALVTILGFKYWGKGEKVLWTIPIFYKCIPFQLHHRKFGFTVEAEDARSSSTQKLAREMLTVLSRGITFAEKALEPMISFQIKEGNISIPNHFHQLDRRYRFFRKRALRAYRQPKPKPKEHKDASGNVTGTSFDLGKADREGFNYAVAMLGAYFSRLEHVLVLLLAFGNYDPESDDLARFIGMIWSEKFKRLFNVNSAPGNKRIYDDLRHIKERYLNTFSHGGFEKAGASLFFHVPYLGPVPVQMSQFGTSVHYSLFPLNLQSFSETLQILDRTDSLLTSDDATKYGMKFIETGLTVSYSKVSRDRYKKAMQSDAAFRAFLDHASYVATTYANMDF